MTGALNQKKIITWIRNDPLYTNRLLKALTRAIGILLLIALLLSVGLALTKQMPFFYSVSEETVTVASGNTLWAIAGDHIGEYPGGIRAYMAEIRRLNGLDGSDLLRVGTELIIPIYRYKLG